MLLVARSLALAFLSYLLLAGRVRRDWQVPLILVIAGAAGNIVDVVRYGAVIDFLHLRFGEWSFPLFNVADSAICLGVSWVLISSFRDHRD